MTLEGLRLKHYHPHLTPLGQERERREKKEARRRRKEEERRRKQGRKTLEIYVKQKILLAFGR